MRGEEKIMTTLPGDLSTLDTEGMGEGEPIWDRMAKIIRARRIDVRQLMAGFDRAKKGFFDLTTLRRALANAFEKQWVELAMTQAEFAEIVEPYITRQPMQKGEPMAFVQWRQFAQDLQMLAETGRPTSHVLERLGAVEAKKRASDMLQKDYGVSMDELTMAFEYFKERINVYSKRGLTDGFRRIDTDHKGSLQGEELRTFFMEDAHSPWFCNDRTIAVLVDFADLNDDDSIGYLELSQVLECEDIIEFAALVPNKKARSQDDKDSKMKIGSHGCTVGEVKSAQYLICDRLINRGSGDLRQNNLRSVLAFMDTYENGMLTRKEFKDKLKSVNVIKHVTSDKKVKGDVDEKVIDTFLDVVDEVARKIEEMMPGDQGGATEAGKVNLAAFAKGAFSQDGFGGFVSIFEIAGIA